MELVERINILNQAAELAQKGGTLSFDEASVAKKAIDNLTNGVSVKLSLTALSKIAEIGQRKGVYTLKDAYFIFMACDGINELPEDEN